MSLDKEEVVSGTTDRATHSQDGMSTTAIQVTGNLHGMELMGDAQGTLVRPGKYHQWPDASRSLAHPTNTPVP
jgi:hypothetical protein